MRELTYQEACGRLREASGDALRAGTPLTEIEEEACVWLLKFPLNVWRRLNGSQMPDASILANLDWKRLCSIAEVLRSENDKKWDRFKESWTRIPDLIFGTWWTSKNYIYLHEVLLWRDLFTLRGERGQAILIHPARYPNSDFALDLPEPHKHPEKIRYVNQLRYICEEDCWVVRQRITEVDGVPHCNESEFEVIGKQGLALAETAWAAIPDDKGWTGEDGGVAKNLRRAYAARQREERIARNRDKYFQSLELRRSKLAQLQASRDAAFEKSKQQARLNQLRSRALSGRCPEMGMIHATSTLNPNGKHS